MKFFKKTSVYEESLTRIRRLYNEFPEVVVSFSGGKDSTIIFNLAMIVAKEMDRLPLKVFFLDQEAEFTQTIELVRRVMDRPDVQPIWIQMPIKIENSATFGAVYQTCWEDGKEWIRDKEPDSKKVNDYGVGIWSGIFSAISEKDFAGQKMCYLAGVRAEESPNRLMSLTSSLKFQDITWGKRLSKKQDHYTFYPIYDWSYTDVWKAIWDNRWDYNDIYNLQYQFGVPVHEMRVSNLHHETSVRHLFYLQEVDADLYNKLVKRIEGIDTAGKMGYDDFYIKDLPFMFADWREYRDFLIEKLVKDPALFETLDKARVKFDQIFAGNEELMRKSCRVVINSTLTGDVAGTKINNFKSSVVKFYTRDKEKIASGAIKRNNHEDSI